MELFYCKNINKPFFELPETEAHHVLQVLRYKVGDKLKVTNGIGNIFDCKINEASKKKCVLEIINEQNLPIAHHQITLAIAPTKSRERMEWCLEKATEIGVQKIQFIQTAYSEKWKVTNDRFEKVLIAAMKQSAQVWLPELLPIINFENWIKQTDNAAQKLICHNLNVTSAQLINVAKKYQHTIIAIGPEGGFSEHEIVSATKNNFECVLLGNTRLRTETAAITALSVLQQINLLN
ncbi:MAG: Ribosomal small subunit methyltransferase [Bacteroidota bacterium]